MRSNATIILDLCMNEGRMKVKSGCTGDVGREDKDLSVDEKRQMISDSFTNRESRRYFLKKKSSKKRCYSSSSSSESSRSSTDSDVSSCLPRKK